GGSSRPVVPGSAPAAVISAAWSPDGRAIAFVRADSLLVMPLQGGAPRLVGTESALHSCTWSPDGRWIGCVTLNHESVLLGTSFGNIAPSAIVLFPAPGGGAPVRITEPRAFNQSPVFTPDGRRLLFLSDRDGPRDVYAVSLTSAGRARGEPERLSTGLDAISISLSADARKLAYAVYGARSNIWSLPIPTGAPVTTAGATPVTTGNQVIEAMRVSRDGRWLVYDSNRRGNADIYRVPLFGRGDSPEQLTTDPADEFAPDLAPPPGHAIAYHSWRTGTRDIEVKPLDGGPVERVTDTPAQESYPVWSPDGQAIVFEEQTPPLRLFVTRRGPGGGRWSQPVALTDSAYDADWSPDGRFISYVYAATDTRVRDLMVIPAAGGTPRRVVASDRPGAPLVDRARWSPDGRTLYFKSHDARGRASFWSVSATAGRGARPRLLVRFADPAWQSARKDFATDGRRLYFAVEDRQSDVFVADLIPR
ncbi:MAG: hypothetical protein ACREME_03110, partial [Gemmatimonadales bacterium]